MSAAVVAGHGDAVRAPVASRAVPFAPVPARAALRTVPGAGVLDDGVRTERVPVETVTLDAAVARSSEQSPQRYQLASTGQLHHRVELGLGESPGLLDVAERAGRHRGDVEAIERVAAGRAAAAVEARPSVSDAGAAVGATAGPASAADLAVCIGLYGHERVAPSSEVVRSKRGRWPAETAGHSAAPVFYSSPWCPYPRLPISPTRNRHRR